MIKGMRNLNIQLLSGRINHRSLHRIAVGGFSHLPLTPVRQISSQMDTKYLLMFHVPKPNTDEVVAAVHKTGAGTYPGGLYKECAFITPGTGTFRPSEKANPHIGTPGDVEKVEENQVQVYCDGTGCMKEAVKALKQAHPYEQVAYFVVQLVPDV